MSSSRVPLIDSRRLGRRRGNGGAFELSIEAALFSRGSYLRIAPEQDLTPPTSDPRTPYMAASPVHMMCRGRVSHCILNGNHGVKARIWISVGIVCKQQQHAHCYARPCLVSLDDFISFSSLHQEFLVSQKSGSQVSLRLTEALVSRPQWVTIRPVAYLLAPSVSPL
ncbi:unnamed protein product [Pleuronectes platessa]|uniref:Uncharacterized protein n=1 Tax=Pleuronectes platessa TaxID=8262 RepID=A0A9N7TV49_PLEPL|nr:unnamed protein product [Pleuronectes platessa]